MNRISFWRLQAIGWTAFALAMATSRIGRFPLMYMLASKGAMGAIGLAYSGFIMRPIYRRYLSSESSPLRTVTITAIVSYVTAVIWTGSHSLVDITFVRDYLDPNATLTNFWSVFGGTLYDAFALLAWSVLYVGIKHQLALQDERERALKAESLAQSARLEALRLQLNPHFLFNSLNAISTLVMDNRGTEATQMIARVADLLRATLHRPEGDTITLAEELDLVHRYLEIERVRLGERLRVEIESVDVNRARVPALLLQPIVENAVRHAVAMRTDGGTIALTAERIGERLRITVDDDGPGKPADIEEKGIGLANARARVEEHYGSSQTFRIEHSPLGGIRVAFEFPYAES